MVSESITITRYSPGGVLARPFVNPEKQGLLQGTTSSTDLAIVGEGFFIVNQNDDPLNEGGDYLLTRAGSFVEDEDGRSEEHTSELQSRMSTSSAVLRLTTQNHD